MRNVLTKQAVFAAVSALALTASWGAFAQSAAPNSRIALVIGNATYPDQALATTANDAGLVAQTLQTAGFDVVGARDLDQKSLQTALRDFLDKAAAAGPDMQAFVYLAGRAQQYNGDNYFLPVDAKIARDGDLPLAAIRISDIAHALAATPGRARILVIDGARSNPYVASNPTVAPGLALETPEAGELIAFDASPGSLAGDEPGPYGVYGKTLAGALRQGGVDITAVFDQTRVLVNQQTKGAVIPWSQSNLGAPYYVFERAADAPPPPPAPAPAVAGGSADEAYYAALQTDTLRGYSDFLRDYPQSNQARRVRAILAARREALYWQRAVVTNTPRAYWTYLKQYPKGPHVGDARRRISALAAAFDPPSDFQPFVYEDLPPPPPAEIEYFDNPDYAFDDYGPPPPPPPPAYVYGYDDDWRDLPPPPPPRGIGFLPVLGVAIPVIAGAIAYHGRGRENGVAPAGFRPPAPPPPAPPALPPRVNPVAPAAPTTTATPAAGGAGRRPGFAGPRPLPPIGGGAPVAAPAGAPAASPAPLTPTGAKPLAPTPLNGTVPARTPAFNKPAALAPLPTPAAPTPAVAPTRPAPSFTPRPAPPAALRPALPPPPVMRAPPPPVVRAPPPPPPVVHAPPPPPPVVHAPPPPPPVVRAPPPPPPVVRAPPPPPPVVRAPPPPPPAVRAPPPPPRAAPPAAARPACGKPPLPAC